MKKNILFSLAASLLFTTTAAHADHHLVFISNIVKIDDADCAVELTISGDDQDAFVATDKITIDDTEVATMESLLEGINAADGNNDTDDTILFGSVSFDESHGINADIAFDDANCEDLDNDAVVAFVNDGNNTIDDIDTDDFSGFGNNTVISKSSSSASAELVDLDEDTLGLTNNAGESATIGSSGGSTSLGTVSCNLTHATNGNPMPGILVAGGLLLILGIFCARRPCD